MLSYQHGYHAGGFADVHKHAALCLLLAHLKQKPAPFCVIDCHAGRGHYDLTGEQANRTGEWQAGIARLLKAAPANEALRPYLDVVADFNEGNGLTRYPGSPAIAARLMRGTDRLVLIEAHPAEHEELRKAFRRDRRVHMHKRDSFEALPGLVPPAERRGLVLIDPSYEIKTEYLSVPAMVETALHRWSSGIHAIWYPLLPDDRHAPLVAGLEALARPVLIAELTGPARDQGLRGTGLAVINPPWRFAENLDSAGAEIAHCLFGPDGKHILRVSGEES
jgi:23S rRNA (adenine2030-N6)-methyltransferase